MHHLLPGGTLSGSTQTEVQQEELRSPETIQGSFWFLGQDIPSSRISVGNNNKQLFFEVFNMLCRTY
jgi:hypothetical protein